MVSIPCPVSTWANETPGHPALITPSENISYAQLEAKIASAQQFLLGSGIQRGEKVGLQFSNSAEYVAIIFALTRIGAIGGLFSTRLPQEKVQRQLASLGCRLFLHDQSWTQPLPEATRVADSAPSLDSPAVAIFTSGSSGEPKAALLSYGNLYYNALGSNQNIPFGPEHRWLLSLPLYHVGGLGILFRAFIAGGSVVIPKPTSELGATIHLHRVTHLSVVTTQLYRLLADPRHRDQLHSLKVILLGGSSVPATLIMRALEERLPIFTSYGLSEMASQVTTTSPDDSPARLNSSGKILKYRELKISSESEILVRGESRFLGYLTGSELVQPFDREGWFHTGDLGRMDDGYLTVLGRRDNLFISGGENIQPEEIERALLEDQSVEDAIVVPVESEEFGFRPVAFVRMTPYPIHEVPELLESLRARLPGFMIPDRILPWPAHLVVAGIKPSRAALKELAKSLFGQF